MPLVHRVALALTVAAVATSTAVTSADDRATEVVGRWKLEGDETVLTTRRDSGYRRPSSQELEDERKRRGLAAGYRIGAADREHEYRFVLVSADGAHEMPLWAWKVQVSDTAPDWSEVELVGARLTQPGVLTLVYREGYDLYVHAVDVRMRREAPLPLPARPHEFVKLGGLDGVHVRGAEVRGRADDGSLSVVVSGKCLVDGQRVQGVLAVATLRKDEGGLRWSSKIEAGRPGDTVRRRASPAGKNEGRAREGGGDQIDKEEAGTGKEDGRVQ